MNLLELIVSEKRKDIKSFILLHRKKRNFERPSVKRSKTNGKFVPSSIIYSPKILQRFTGFKISYHLD